MLAYKRDLNPPISRWFVKFFEFAHMIEYNKGVNNEVADLLSRNPVEEAEEMNNTGLPVLGIKINTDWFPALQRTCSEVKAVIEKLEEGDRATHVKFTLNSGRVYKITKSGKRQLYVPMDLGYDVWHPQKCYYFVKIKDFAIR